MRWAELHPGCGGGASAAATASNYYLEPAGVVGTPVMREPGSASGGPLPERVRVLLDVATALAPLHRALAQGTAPTAAELAALHRVGTECQPWLRANACGGIAVHLAEYVRRLDARGSIGDVREPLVPLAELVERAIRSLPPAEQILLAQGQQSLVEQPAALPPPASPPPAGAGAPAPPRLLTMAGSHKGQVAKVERSSTPPPSLQPPPLLDPRQVASPPERFGDPQAFQPVPPGMSAPGPAGLHPAGLPAAGPDAASAAGVPQSIPAEPPRKAPQLAVRTMLGLRAFGSRGTRPESSAPPPASPVAPALPGRPGSLFGLRRAAGAMSLPPLSASPTAPPPRLDHSPAGLPPLPPMASTPQRNEPTGGELAAGAPQVNDLFGGIARARGGRRSEPPRGQPALLHNRQQEGTNWRLGAIAAAVLVLVLGGFATLIVYVSRGGEAEERTPTAAAAGSTEGEETAPTTGEETLPRTRLLNEDETFRALLAQVHGRGKESPELRALVDEQAALAARTLSKDKCEGSPTACQEWLKIREAVLGNEGVKRVRRRQEAGSIDRVTSGWMVGLRLPEIPVENDERVKRSFEFYTENPVGRETFQAMLFRCGAHKDMIQSALVRHGLPADLWAIVFVESGCSPHATSPVGAAGMWQFMPGAARAYHLRVKEGVIDERRSPPKSTEAAVRFLRDMRDKLEVYQKGNKVWDLVFAGYNCGPFGMVARLEKTEGDVGFWELVDAELLPEETSNYAPAIQAVSLILNNLQRLKFTSVQLRAPQLTSDLEVAAGTRLGLVARAASTSADHIRSLNLDISGDATPDVPHFAVQVPKDVVWQARDTLKELIANKDDMDKCVPPSFDWGRQQFTAPMGEACRRKLGAAAPAK